MNKLNYSYFVECRPNVHVKNGHEWALHISINDKRMVLVTYDKEPTEADVTSDLTVFERSIDIYKWSLVGYFNFPDVKQLKKD